jgi:8-oxo-dGTP diphosphatase
MNAQLKSKKPKRFSIVEVIISNYKGEILLLKRSDKNSIWVNKWQLPGGKVEKNESSLKAIKREIREETSFLCPKLAVDKFFCFKHTFKGKNECVSLRVYSCNSMKNEPVLSKDHSSFKFVNPTKIKKSSLTEISRISIFGL